MLRQLPLGNRSAIGRNLPQTRISVVIPTFNRATVICDALKTVFAQTYPVHEVIVVDDASSDATCDIVRQFGDDRVKLLVRDENGGGGAARSDGIASATGDFIAFLDSDDLWMPDKLERQVTKIFLELSEEQRERCICYTNLRESSEQGEGRPRNNRGLREGERIGDYIFVSQQTVQTSTFLVSSALAKRVQFARDLLRHQDWDFVMRAEMAGAHFVYLPETLVLFRQAVPGGRISTQVDAAPSLFWLSRVEGKLLSESAKNLFLATIVMPRLFSTRPLYAASWMTKSLLRGDIPRHRTAKLVGRMVLPPAIIDKIRVWLARFP